MRRRLKATGWVVLLLAAAPACPLTTLQVRGQEPPPDRVPLEKLDPRKVLEPSATTRAVGRGLEYLKETQLPDGSWISGFGKNTGVVGLATLAFLSAGHVPGRGPYGAVVDRAVQFLLSHRKRGMLVHDTSHGPLYEHAIATIVLGEVLGMTGPPAARGAVRGAAGRPDFDSLERVHRESVRLILRSQKVPKRHAIYTGGWRYHPARSRDADLSVTGWQVLALRAAQNAGLDVPERAIVRAIGFTKRCIHTGGGFLYEPLSERPNAAMTGTGVLCLELCGDRGSEEARRGGDWLLKHRIERKTPFYYYSLYYANQAMYQLGGRHWTEWRAFSEPELLKRQKPDGRWELPACVHEEQAGPAYTTALGVLALTVDYKFLPIYQR